MVYNVTKNGIQAHFVAVAAECATKEDVCGFPQTESFTSMRTLSISRHTKLPFVSCAKRCFLCKMSTFWAFLSSTSNVPKHLKRRHAGAKITVGCDLSLTIVYLRYSVPPLSCFLLMRLTFSDHT